MEEQNVNQEENQENLESQDQAGVDQSNSVEKAQVENEPADEKKENKEKSDFPGEELEQPSIKEASAEETQEAEKVKPVIIEWKKPFFLMFGIGVAAIILMLILNK